MRQRLTAGRVAAFKCETHKPQSFLWDSEVPGLAVRATPTGARSFIFQAKLNGKDLRVTIGSIDHWDIEGDAKHPGAREEARRLQRLIDVGIDPRDAREDEARARAANKAAAVAKEVLVSDIWPDYVAERKKSKKWGARHVIDHERLVHPGGTRAKRGDRKTIPGALAKIMKMRLADVTPSVVTAWLAGEVQTRATQARLAFGALRAFIHWCAARDEYKSITSADAVGSRVAREILPKKAAKDDVLQREQLKAWFAAVRNLANPVIVAYLQALLLTGARREEMATLEWRNVDFKWRTLTIRDKVDGTRKIPLPPYLSKLLSDLPHDEGAVYVFASAKSKSGRLQDPTSAHAAALDSAGIDGLSIHGLRRSFATLAEWIEIPAGVVAQIMGHHPSATAERHYKRRPVDLLRVWHVKYESWLLAQARIDFKPRPRAKKSGK